MLQAVFSTARCVRQALAAAVGGIKPNESLTVLPKYRLVRRLANNRLLGCSV
jgi:hypothetical protein